MGNGLKVNLLYLSNVPTSEIYNIIHTHPTPPPPHSPWIQQESFADETCTTAADSPNESNEATQGLA
jgi:hypothetical protein